MDEDPSALTPGAVLAGKFRVLRCLGMGGMGAVYEIEHELTKHRRALKLLHANMAAIPGVVERFLREASAAGRVGNPHIVETFDAGTLDTGEPYLVMEILRGETLTDRIARGPMSATDMVDLIGQACDGIQAAHDAGIVHRDLKPDNLFVLDVEGRPFVKILDFGISKFDPSKTGGMQLTQEGAALGTPYYMSPEQIRGEINLDARADIYALGVILYECAVGQRPFDAEHLTQLAVLIHTGNPKPIHEFRQDLPAGFSELVMRAMATDRHQRTQTSAGLRADLERFGQISFKGQSGIGPVPSVFQSKPPERVVPAHSMATMATSAAGVSVRQALAADSKKSQRGPIIAGFAVLGLLGVGLAVGLRGHPPAEAEVGAGATLPVLPQASAAMAPPAPPAASSASSAATAEGVAPQASASGQAPKFPVVAPTLKTPPPEVVAAPAGGPPAAAAPKAKRTDERGLAKDNPFK